MLVLNLPFKALMFLTLMRPSLVLFVWLWGLLLLILSFKVLLFLTLWRRSLVLFLVFGLKLVRYFLKVCWRLALLLFLICCLFWLDLVASPPLKKERKIEAVQEEGEP